MLQEDRSSEEELFIVTRIQIKLELEKGDDVTVVTVHGRVISRVKSRVLSVPVRRILPGI